MSLPKKPVKHNIFKSFKYAFSGIFTAFKRERNLRIQILIGLVSSIVAVSFGWLGLAVLNLAIMSIVISFELFNTSIETLCDLVEPKKNEKVKIIKDFSAAAVLIVSLGWLVILIYQAVNIYLFLT